MPNLSQRKINGGYDDYFTKTNIAKNTIETTLTKIPHKGNTLFLEPSAGNGAFSKILLKIKK